MTSQMITISNAAQDVANAAREAYALQRATRHVRSHVIASAIDGLEETLHADFQTLAAALGYSVSRIETASLEAAE